MITYPIPMVPGPEGSAIHSPTVTAVNVPEGYDWKDLNARFRRHGLAAGGNYGPLSGRVFRLGHMGSQADMALVQSAIDVVKKVFQKD